MPKSWRILPTPVHALALALLPSLAGLIFLGLTLSRKRLATAPTLPRLILLGPIFYEACDGAPSARSKKIRKLTQTPSLVL